MDPYIHPAILTLAKTIGRAGWRVSSIYRPDNSHHRTGLALDCCPLVYSNQNYGPKTAKLLLRFSKEAFPLLHFITVSERDHVHIELARRSAYGWIKPSGALEFFRPGPGGER